MKKTGVAALSRTAHLCHGFRVRDRGRNTIARLTGTLLNLRYSPALVDYGSLGLLGVLLFNDNVAQQLQQHVDEGDIGIGHSNGCAILLEAAEKGAPFKALVFINPALDVNVTFPKHVKQVLVFYTPRDHLVRWAKLLRVVLRPFHRGFRWGEMGAVGHYGKVQAGQTVTSINMLPVAQGHSDIFNQKGLHWIRDKLQRHLKKSHE